MGRNKVIYKCEKCGYTTNKKCNYFNHLNRKKSCCEKTKINLIKNITNKNIEDELKKVKLKKVKLEMEKYKLENIKFKIEREYYLKYKIEKEKLESKLEEERNSKKELITTNKDFN